MIRHISYLKTKLKSLLNLFCWQKCTQPISWFNLTEKHACFSFISAFYGLLFIYIYRIVSKCISFVYMCVKVNDLLYFTVDLLYMFTFSCIIKWCFIYYTKAFRKYFQVNAQCPYFFMYWFFKFWLFFLEKQMLTEIIGSHKENRSWLWGIRFKFSFQTTDTI